MGTTEEDPTGPAAASPPTRLLVLGMAHRDGTIWSEELYPVAEACGLTSDQVRSQLRRLVGEGLFDRDGGGRDATYRATRSGSAVLTSMLRRHNLAYAQDMAGRGWDRRWRLAAFAIPESRRADRDALRERVRQLGAAPIQGGLYVTPHAWDQEIRAEVERLDVTPFVALAATDDLEVGGEADPRRLAATLWPLEEIAARYRDFCDTYREVPEQLESMTRRGERLREVDFLPGALHIAIRFSQCFDDDPLLPPELLPRPWPGREARDLLARCRRQGVLAREDKGGPALFRVFDEVILNLP